MKLTKNCLYPWTFMQIHGGGMMQCCAVGPDTDQGDFLLDYWGKIDSDPDCDPFNSEGLQAMREGILTGNLRPMCRNCFFAANEYITTEELKKRLKKLLAERMTEEEIEKADLRKVHAYTWMAISFTNRCNLSCIYCVQSIYKDTNPYFKMEFPYEYAEPTLDYLASQGIEQFSTCVEGEATLYKHWYEIFSKFHAKYPHIKMRMTTNLNRRFSDQEMELLINYYALDVSLDSLDPQLYRQMRRNGNLNLLLENLDLIYNKVKESGIKGPIITLHMVVCDATWRSMEEIADYAFERGWGIQLGDYEERANTVAVQQKLVKPIREISLKEQKLAKEMIERIQEKGKQLDCPVIIQGMIFSAIKANVDEDYNQFQPYDDNPVFKAFFDKIPKGTKEQYLDIAYDTDHISHEGIVLGRGQTLRLSGMENVKNVTVREIHVYRQGTASSRYGQTVLLRYRRKVVIENGRFEYTVNCNNMDVEKVLLEVTDYELLYKENQWQGME